MRGKGPAMSPGHITCGITPACAGKRHCKRFSQLVYWDHPRMCGEKKSFANSIEMELGSPPHVRGKGGFRPSSYLLFRITPACAGKSFTKNLDKANRKDHPRMCGEKLCILLPLRFPTGSPPHVRGKVKELSLIGVTDRITPACAGKRLKRSRSTVPPVAIVPLFPSVCNKPVVSDGSPAGRDAPLFLPAENAVPASPAYNLRSL